MTGLPAAFRFAALLALCLFATSPMLSEARAAPPAQATRLDPYKNFKFRLEVDGRTVAGMAIVRMPEVVKHRAGADPSTATKSPGRDKYEAITLERGLTQDSDFTAWASAGSKRGAAAARELRLVSFDDSGRQVAAYRIHRAWVSEYRALPNLDAGANAVALQHIKLENEGWERDPGY